MNMFNYLQHIWIKEYHMLGNEFLTDPDMRGMMLRSATTVAIISNHSESSGITHKCTACHGSLRLWNVTWDNNEQEWAL